MAAVAERLSAYPLPGSTNSKEPLLTPACCPCTWTMASRPLAASTVRRALPEPVTRTAKLPDPANNGNALMASPVSRNSSERVPPASKVWVRKSRVLTVVPRRRTGDMPEFRPSPSKSPWVKSTTVPANAPLPGPMLTPNVSVPPLRVRSPNPWMVALSADARKPMKVPSPSVSVNSIMPTLAPLRDAPTKASVPTPVPSCAKTLRADKAVIDMSRLLPSLRVTVRLPRRAIPKVPCNNTEPAMLILASSARDKNAPPAPTKSSERVSATLLTTCPVCTCMRLSDEPLRPKSSTSVAAMPPTLPKARLASRVMALASTERLSIGKPNWLASSVKPSTLALKAIHERLSFASVFIGRSKAMAKSMP